MKKTTNIVISLLTFFLLATLVTAYTLTTNGDAYIGGNLDVNGTTIKQEDINQLFPITTQIGETELLETEIENEHIKYKQYQNVTLTGWKPNATLINITNKEYTDNTTYTETTTEMTIYNYSQKGEPIVSFGELTKITYQDKEYQMDIQMCWVCQDQIACLTKTDGGTNTEHRATEYKCNNGKAIIRSGESGFIKNLTTNTYIYQRYD